VSERLPLILLPGLLCDAALWQHQVRDLADIAETTVADTSAQDSMAAIARSVLDAAPPRFALAGLSMGGYVAFEIMRQAPERVVKLALLNTSPRPDTEEQVRRRRGLIQLARMGRFKGVTPRLLPLLIHPDRMEEEDLTGIVYGMAERLGQGAFERQQTAILNRIDSRPTLAAIACPTLVIVGRQDALTPPELAQEMADGIRGAHLHIVEDCGHLSPLERPAAVTAAMLTWLLS